MNASARSLACMVTAIWSGPKVQWLQLLANHCGATSLLANPVDSEVVTRASPLKHQQDQFSASTAVPSPKPLRGKGLARFETPVAEHQ